MSQLSYPRSYTPLDTVLQRPRPEAPFVAPPRRAARGRVLVIRGYSRRWPRLSRIAWWVRLVPARLAAG